MKHIAHRLEKAYPGLAFFFFLFSFILFFPLSLTFLPYYSFPPFPIFHLPSFFFPSFPYHTFPSSPPFPPFSIFFLSSFHHSFLPFLLYHIFSSFPIFLHFFHPYISHPLFPSRDSCSFVLLFFVLALVFSWRAHTVQCFLHSMSSPHRSQMAQTCESIPLPSSLLKVPEN